MVRPRPSKAAGDYHLRMKKLALLTALLLVLSASATVAVASSDAELETDKKRYRSEQPVTITLTNRSDQEFDFQTPWRIENKAGETVSRFHWTGGESPLGPGESLSWVWDQSPNDCGSDGACTKIGGYVSAGTYTAIVGEGDTGTLKASFQIGEYFTVGFRSRPSLRFGVFVAKADEIEQMRAETTIEPEERTLIVSGKVRGWRAGYNPDWRFVMDPRSIFLGEVFIEVCDGSPWYVQRHLEDWKGERWCPWSSYVIREGRP